MRLTTVTRYLAASARCLRHPHFERNPLAIQLRQQIRECKAAALTDDAEEVGAT